MDFFRVVIIYTFSSLAWKNYMLHDVTCLSSKFQLSCPCWNLFYLSIFKIWLLTIVIRIIIGLGVINFTCSFYRFGRLYTRRMVQSRRSQELCSSKGIRLVFWLLASQDSILEGWYSLCCYSELYKFWNTHIQPPVYLCCYSESQNLKYTYSQRCLKLHKSRPLITYTRQVSFRLSLVLVNRPTSLFHYFLYVILLNL